MTATTLTLADFLLQRLAEDEAAARAATPGPWFSDTVYSTVTAAPYMSARAAYDADHWDGVDRFVVPESMDSAVSDVNLAHIARHDPARVLAECESKRAIVELHEQWPVLVGTEPTFDAEEGGSDLNQVTLRMSKQFAWATEREYRARFGTEPPTAPMLRALAKPYADHPDFREEWA